MANLRKFTATLVLVAAVGAAAASVGSIETISVTPAGGAANGRSGFPLVSADGRFVAFASSATDLTSAATPAQQVFLRDRRSQATELVSAGPGGAGANGSTFNSPVTPDGRFVAFASAATDLVAGDGNGVIDVFLRDRTLGTTERISVARDGGDASDESGSPSLTDDGRFVAFDSLAGNLVKTPATQVQSVFVRDRWNGTTERIDRGIDGDPDNSSVGPQITPDGRFVVFQSWATNLVHGDTNRSVDVFVFDRRTDATERVSLTTSGRQANGDSALPGISADGRFVVFQSQASNLGAKLPPGQAGVFVRDRILKRTELVTAAPRGSVATVSEILPEISGDGRVVTFLASERVGDSLSGWGTAYVHDRQTGITRAVNVDTSGGAADDLVGPPDVSRDGRTVVFASKPPAAGANDPTQVFAVSLDLPPDAAVPVADAGPDLSVPSTGLRTKVRLDASGSSAPDGSRLRFAWTEGGKRIASGVRPAVRLTPGVHAIWLIATDRRHRVGVGSVVATVTE